MRAKKIVHIISSLKMGGAEMVLLTLIKNLHKEFEQEVVYFHDGPIRNHIEALGISTHHIQGSLFTYGPIFYYRLIKLINRLNPDMIHSSLWAANFFSLGISKMLRVPLVCSLHAMRTHEGTIRNVLDRWTLRYADHLIAVSEHVAHSFLAARVVQPDSLTIIPNAIDAQHFLQCLTRSSVSRSHLGIKSGDIVIGSVGRFVEVKNYPYLIEALSRLVTMHPNLKLLLIGTGPEESALRKLATELAVEKHLIFVIDQPAHNYYHLMDCFVQPSRSEGLSIALLEALCAGIPCIVSSISKTHPVIKDGYNGILIDPQNEQDLELAIMRVIQDEHLKKRLASHGYQTVIEQFDISAMKDQYAQLFKAHTHITR